MQNYHKDFPRGNNAKFKIIFTFLIIILIFVFLFLILDWKSGKNFNNNKIESFAKCLTDKKITMYGAEWCSHCQEEKTNFGEAFKYVLYVECSENTKECLELDIQGYPTWIFPDGKKLEGYQGLKKMSQESGCVL